MSSTHYDRLSALDATFLDLEGPGVHMHVGAVGICEPGSFRSESGGVDFDRILAVVEAGLDYSPRFRQKLDAVPISGHPIWVDDQHFNLLYHVRHTALPAPGDERQLKRLIGRIMSEKLDREKPMWELWFVEGLESGELAVVSKVHHAVVDGISGVDLLAAFMGADADHRLETREVPWKPRPAPGSVGMLTDEIWHRATLPGRLLRGAVNAVREPEQALEGATHTASGLLETLAKSLQPGSETPFNVPIGPHRRFDWTQFEISQVRDVKKKLGGTINDVVLTVVAGAVRVYLDTHGLDPDEIDFRCFVPVSTRTPEQRGELGNRVSLVVASLPVSEADLRGRFDAVHEEMRQVKGSGQVQGAEMMEEISDWTTTSLITNMSRLASSRRSFNMVVTNVPGPRMPVYMDGGRLLELYPLVPLFTNQALGIALFSYADGLYWGFNACWDALPDLHEFVQAVDREFEALRRL